MIKKIFLVIYADEVGGAELRFFGLWKEAIKQKDKNLNFNIVISKQLLEVLLLRENEEDQKTIRSHKNVILYDFEIGYLKLKEFVNKKVKDTDIIHFIDVPPLKSSNVNQLFSITQSSLKNLNFKGQIAQILGTLYSDSVDILDPSIYKKFKKLFFYKKSSLSLTTNSYCDVDKFETKPFQEKKDWFVFLGRFEEGKQVDKLINILPKIYVELRDSFKNDLKFIFIGYGSLKESVENKIKEPEYNNIPIELMYSSTPHKILKESKFFFSLQMHNNYPSRSLMEAMSAGNIPICTDVGETKWLAKPDFSFYVPENFREDDFVETFTRIRNTPLEKLARKSELARQTVLNEHTIEKMFKYYYEVYNTLSIEKKPE